MRQLCQLISTLLNPLYTPLAGSLLYFLISPRFIPYRSKNLILAAIFIITIVIPIVFYFLLRNLGWITHKNLRDPKERKIPLYLSIILTFVILKKITPIDYTHELHFYFLGILVSLFTCLLLTYKNIRVSMHLMGICSLCCFIIGLSLYFKIQLTGTIALLVFATGLLSSARLYLNSQSTKELLLGAFIGVIPQAVGAFYWLHY